MAAIESVVPITLPADPAGLTEAARQTYVDYLGIPKFVDAADRDVYFTDPLVVLRPGQFCYLIDIDELQRYDGATLAWSIASGGPHSLGSHTDVDLTSVPPADQDTLIWDQTAGQWIPTASFATQEVIVGPDDPLIADPASPVDVWYDTDEPDPPPLASDPFVLKAQVRAHHIYGAVTTSPWTWTLKAGTYLTQFCVSCVASANGLRYANLNMDGVNVAQSKMYFNVTGQHHFMNTGVAVLTVPADGDYAFDITMSASATMDTNDFGHFTIIPCDPGAVS